MRIFYTFILLLIGQNAMAIEEPAFKIVLKSEAFEVRQYAPILVAETLAFRPPIWAHIAALQRPQI